MSTTSDLSGVEWIKSSYSNTGGGDCVEWAPNTTAAFGVVPVCIETAAGRDEYQTRQRALSARAVQLRARLIDRISLALGAPLESPV